jgi:hypothetical protein
MLGAKKRRKTMKCYFAAAADQVDGFLADGIRAGWAPMSDGPGTILVFGDQDHAEDFGRMVHGRSLAVLEIEGEYDFVFAGGRDDQGHYVRGPRGGLYLTEDVHAENVTALTGATTALEF